MPRKRVYSGSLRAFHDDGTPWMTKDILIDAFSHKVIKRWSIILHDKCNYTEEEYLASVERNKKDPSMPIFQVGAHKADHWHFVCEAPSGSLDSYVLAKWLGVPESMIEFPAGRGAFLDCVEYLTHENEKEQEKGKYLYPDDEVITSDGFDFRAELLIRAENKARYGRDLGVKEKFRQDVLIHGKTLKQCLAEDALNYANDFNTLHKLRLQYLCRLKPPTTRMNFYVCGQGGGDAATSGQGGIGKGLMCRALARSLFPNFEDDEDIYFTVGARGSAFEGYDGQPVIIWNDRRAVELLKELGGRGNVFDVFEVHPDPVVARQNVKFGSVVLSHAVNIINGIEGYVTFLNGLAGEYKDKDGTTHTVEDKGQAYRRFPFIIPVHEDDFDLLLNRGFMENTMAFTEYVEYKHIRGNMQKIRVACGANEALARELERRMVAPVIEHYDALMAKSGETAGTEDEIRAMFRGVGTQLTDEELDEQMIAEYEHQQADEAEQLVLAGMEQEEERTLATAEFVARQDLGEPVDMIDGVICFPTGYRAYNWIFVTDLQERERLKKMQRAEIQRYKNLMQVGLSCEVLTADEKKELASLRHLSFDGSLGESEALRLRELDTRATMEQRANMGTI